MDDAIFSLLFVITKKLKTGQTIESVENQV